MFTVLSTGLFTVIQILVALTIGLIAYIKWIHQYWKMRGVPYMEPTFPSGNLTIPSYDIGSLAIQSNRLYDQIKARRLKHCGIYLILKPMYCPMDLDLIKNIMTKDFQYFTDRGVYYNERDDPLSANLFAIGGLKWRNLRHKLTPTFTSGKIKMMFPTLLECEVPLAQALEDCCQKKQPVNIKDAFARFTTNIISSCAFGVESDCFKDDDAPFRKYGRKVFEVSTIRNLLIMLSFNLPSVGRFLGICTTEPEVSQFFMQVVRDTIEYREKHHIKRNDFLQLLLTMKSDDDSHDGTKLTMDELAAQCFIFFAAGFETSSTTSTFLLYELARHQQIQQKLRDEINQVLAKYHGQVTYEAINDMKYMDQVINESLRKYPPVPFLTRECVKDYTIPHSGTVLETGTLVFIPVWGIHLDPEYYPNPDEFDPDRFSEENKEQRHPYAHIPFGEGPRICIGMRFGLLQTKVGLTSLLRNYKFTINSKTREPLVFIPTSFVPAIDGDLWLNVEKVQE